MTTQHSILPQQKIAWVSHYTCLSALSLPPALERDIQGRVVWRWAPLQGDPWQTWAPALSTVRSSTQFTHQTTSCGFTLFHTAHVARSHGPWPVRERSGSEVGSTSPVWNSAIRETLKKKKDLRSHWVSTGSLSYRKIWSVVSLFH